MKLDNSFLDNREELLSRGYILPKFDISKVRDNTKKNPEWIHFGGGNIFRAYIANLSQEMLDLGFVDTGVITCSGFDKENIEYIYRVHDNHSINVTLNTDGSFEKKIISSITEALLLDRNEEDFNRLIEIFENPSLKIASFTITEKGYSIYDDKKEIKSDILSDLEAGPDSSKSYMGSITSLIYRRYLTGNKLTLISMDNCSNNGEKLKEPIKYIASFWVKFGLVNEGFLEYIDNSLSFPITMIDKITPRPDSNIRDILVTDGFTDMDIIVTKKKTYLAPFTNAEKPEYLVIEDNFINGKLPFNEVGVYLTDRETVKKVEKMKVSTCLNPIHTALAIYGCILGYTKISEEMKNPYLVRLVNELGYKEGMPVVSEPKILSPKDFLNEVLTVRVPNPYLPDTPQRIAMDTSQKIPVRFGETMAEYINRGLALNSLKCIPFVFSGWLRYLMGVDDNGNNFEVSADPLYDSLKEILKDIHLGEKDRKKVESIVECILRDTRIFKFDLVEVGLAKKVIDIFMEEIEGVSSVNSTLIKYFGGN